MVAALRTRGAVVERRTDQRFNSRFCLVLFASVLAMCTACGRAHPQPPPPPVPYADSPDEPSAPAPPPVPEPAPVPIEEPIVTGNASPVVAGVGHHFKHRKHRAQADGTTPRPAEPPAAAANPSRPVGPSAAAVRYRSAELGDAAAPAVSLLAGDDQLSGAGINKFIAVCHNDSPTMKVDFGCDPTIQRQFGGASGELGAAARIFHRRLLVCKSMQYSDERCEEVIRRNIQTGDKALLGGQVEMGPACTGRRRFCLSFGTDTISVAIRNKVVASGAPPAPAGGAAPTDDGVGDNMQSTGADVSYGNPMWFCLVSADTTVDDAKLYGTARYCPSSPANDWIEIRNPGQLVPASDSIAVPYRVTWRVEVRKKRVRDPHLLLIMAPIVDGQAQQHNAPIDWPVSIVVPTLTDWTSWLTALAVAVAALLAALTVVLVRFRAVVSALRGVWASILGRPSQPAAAEPPAT